MPIPKEKRDDKFGMRVRPRGVEIHVNGERAGPPDGKRGEQSPALFDILARQAEGQEQAKKTIDGCGEGHGDSIWSGKAVSGDRGTEGASEKDGGMRKEEKRRP